MSDVERHVVFYAGDNSDYWTRDNNVNEDQ
jgi:hypothetical protein